MTDYRESFKSLLENTFISMKGGDEYIIRETLSFLEKVLSFMPDSLFRYRTSMNIQFPHLRKERFPYVKQIVFPTSMIP